MQDEASPGNLPVTWTGIPTSLLQAELSRRQEKPERPQCGSGDDRHGYNTPLHVFALFLILILSVLACSFPIIVKRFPKLPVPHHALFLSRHFGTGVLIATGFVHLLPTAFTSLTDPCLPPFWTEGYPAMAGFIAMVAMFVVVGVEMFFATKGAGHSHASEYTTFGNTENGTASRGGHGHGHNRPPMHARKESLRPFKQGHIGPDGDREGIALQDAPQPKRRDSGESGNDDSDLDLDELDPDTDVDTSAFLSGRSNGAANGSANHQHGAGSASPTPGHLSEYQQQQKMLLQCMLLEAGILFHSVFIGMALSVATGTPFIVLLIAISFHQTFEGLALGSRIAAITAFPKGSAKPWLMALAYGTTTPAGQAIGLLVHNLYDPASQMGLLMVGIMNAISSGLLLFAGLVELLAEDFLSDQSYETLQGTKRLEACAAVVAGAMLMALVGAWA